MGSTYSVTIEDDLGGDVLMGYAAACDYNATPTSDVIRIAADPADGVAQAVPVMGTHRFVVDTDADETFGVFDLYYYPYLCDGPGLI